MERAIKKILVSPLDWGLGHAARCIPIIRYLLQKNCEVIMGADGRPLQLLQKEFPSCEFVTMPGYKISYPKNGSMVLKMAVQIPQILAGIKREHEQLQTIIKEKRIDAVISDNRFGLWSREAPCVFITHQVMVKSPLGETFIHQLNKNYIRKYSECWVPDQPPPNPSLKEEGSIPPVLSGDLGHKFPLPENAKHIGVLSRFRKSSIRSVKNKLLVLLSGPEPQRTVFEKKILEQLSPWRGAGGEALVVQGITEKNDRRKVSEYVEVVSHLTSEELQKEIQSSEIILSRPGYSTVMDLAVLGKKVVFVPTPGQTEQEYLGQYFSEKKIAYSVSQKKFDLKAALRESEKYSGFTARYSGEHFKEALDLFLAKTQSPQ